jgi:excisionase family DNA binding protein
VSEQERLLTLKEVADFVGVAPATLYQWRHRGEGPTGYKFGSGRVRYRMSEVQAWLDRQADKPKVAGVA